jgi:hypothetical protein
MAAASQTGHSFGKLAKQINPIALRWIPLTLDVTQSIR